MLLQNNSYFLWLNIEQIILNPSNLSANPFKQKSTLCEPLLLNPSTGSWYCLRKEKNNTLRNLVFLTAISQFRSHFERHNTKPCPSSHLSCLCVLRPSRNEEQPVRLQVHQIMSWISNHPGSLLLRDRKISKDQYNQIILYPVIAVYLYILRCGRTGVRWAGWQQVTADGLRLPWSQSTGVTLMFTAQIYTGIRSSNPSLGF